MCRVRFSAGTPDALDLLDLGYAVLVGRDAVSSVSHQEG